MIRLDQHHILMIEPTGARSTSPLIDDITRKMAGALASARHGSERYRGWHQCTGAGCHAHSDNRNWFVASPGGELATNSLAVHYLAYHREDVPASELDAVAALEVDPTQPTAEQLQ